jgi:hypothetical protein
MLTLPPEAETKLETEKNIWVASVRPDGRPHLAPVWFAWHAGKLYICTGPGSVKARNISQNPRVALALEGGSHPVICEGIAAPAPAPGSAEMAKWPPSFGSSTTGTFRLRRNTRSFWRSRQPSG